MAKGRGRRNCEAKKSKPATKPSQDFPPPLTAAAGSRPRIKDTYQLEWQSQTFAAGRWRGRVDQAICQNAVGQAPTGASEGGPDVLVSIRVFDSADEAFASNEIAANWMRDNVLAVAPGMPEVMAGNVLVAQGKSDAGDAR